MFPILMALCFAVFGISMLLAHSARGAAATPSVTPDDGKKAEPPPSAAIPAKVEAIINERIAQLDEKLVDLHTRTASQLKVTVEDAEERLRQIEKEAEGRLGEAGTSADEAPSTEEIPDIKRIMRERMEQFDEKLIDMHAKVAKRLEATAKEVEDKLVGQAKELSDKLPATPGGPAPELGAESTEKLEKLMQERLEQFDEKIVDMHTRIAKRLEEAAEEQEKKIQSMRGGGDAGAAPTIPDEKIQELEAKIEALASQAAAPPEDEVPGVLIDRIGVLEEKIAALATQKVSEATEGGSAEDRVPTVLIDRLDALEEKVAGLATGKVSKTGEGEPEGPAPSMPDLEHLMQERMEQFDAKIIDMHTRIARRLEEAAEEQEKKIQGMGGGAAGGVSPDKIIELDDKINALVAGGGAGSAQGPNFEELMKERMKQFDEKLIDMHTRMARRLEEAATEQEKNILTIGDDLGRNLSERLDELEAKVKMLGDMTNQQE